MLDLDLALHRRLRFAQLLLFVLVIVMVLVIGTALAERRVDLAIVAILLLVVGLPVAAWVKRMRKELIGGPSTGKAS